jgi:hypothetical protein
MFKQLLVWKKTKNGEKLRAVEIYGFLLPNGPSWQRVTGTRTVNHVIFSSFCGMKFSRISLARTFSRHEDFSRFEL